VTLCTPRLMFCDWHGMARDWSRIIEGVRNGGARVSRPFAFLAGPASAADQLKCSRIYAGEPHSTERNAVVVRRTHIARSASYRLSVGRLFASTQFLK